MFQNFKLTRENMKSFNSMVKMQEKSTIPTQEITRLAG